MNELVNIVWKGFETATKLDQDKSYQQLVIRAYTVIVQNPGSNCTCFCERFFRRSQDHYGNLQPGRMLIGPGDGGSYTHEAVGILDKTKLQVIAVFDPIRNAPLGQLNASVSSANDRYSLKQWLDYKSRWHHEILDVTVPNFWQRPFCIYQTNQQYIRGNIDYMVVKGTLS